MDWCLLNGLVFVCIVELFINKIIKAEAIMCVTTTSIYYIILCSLVEHDVGLFL